MIRHSSWRRELCEECTISLKPFRGERPWIDNKFDSNAILILTESKKKLGYVPEKDNVIFARLMDAGKLLIARIGCMSD